MVHMKDNIPSSASSDKPSLRERIDWYDVRHNVYAMTGIVAITATLYAGVRHPDEALHVMDTFSERVTAPVAQWVSELAVGS